MTILHAGNGRSANQQQWFINIVAKKKEYLFKPPHRLILGKKKLKIRKKTLREGGREAERQK